MNTKPFIVMDRGRCFRFIRGSDMYVVEGLDIEGVTTQGSTFEAALENAHDAADLMEDFHGGVKEPNAVTQEAMDELERGNGKRFTSVSALMDDLNADY